MAEPTLEQQLKALQENLLQLQDEKASLEKQLAGAHEQAHCSSGGWKQQLQQEQAEKQSLAQQLESANEQLRKVQSNNETLVSELQSTLVKLDAWSTDELHPSFVGNYTAPHGAANNTVITIEPTSITFTYDEKARRLIGGDEVSSKVDTCEIDRLAPYVFVAEHPWGRSMFVLLPGGEQMIEANLTDGHSHLFSRVV